MAKIFQLIHLPARLSILFIVSEILIFIGSRGKSITIVTWTLYLIAFTINRNLARKLPNGIINFGKNHYRLNDFNHLKRLSIWIISGILSSAAVAMGIHFFWPQWATHDWIEALVPATLFGFCIILTTWREYTIFTSIDGATTFQDYKIFWISILAVSGALCIPFVDQPKHHAIWLMTHLYSAVLGYIIGSVVLMVRSMLPSPSLTPPSP